MLCYIKWRIVGIKGQSYRTVISTQNYLSNEVLLSVIPLLFLQEQHIKLRQLPEVL